jgi:PST family polysaccharide transporter
MTPADAPAGVEARSAHRLGSRVANSAALLWVLQMVLRGLQFVTLVVLARLLTPADIGIVALATTVIGVLDVLTNVQVGSALVRATRLSDGHFNTAFTLNVLRGLLTATILVGLSWPIAHFMGNPGLRSILCVLAIPALVNACANPRFILFGRNLDFSMEVRRRSAGALVGSLVSIVVAFAFRSYWALIAATVAQAVVSTALSYWKVPGGRVPRWSLSHSREMLGFGTWLLVQNMLGYLALRAEYFFIGRIMDTKTLGAYHLGNQINTMATGDVVPTLTRALFPAFAMIHQDPERLRRTYLNVQATCLALALPIGFGLGLLAEPLILLFFGRGWSLAVEVVRFIAPISAIQTMGAGVEVLAMAMNRPQGLAARSVVNIIVRTAAIVVGFWMMGLTGLLLGRTVSGTIFAFFSLSLAARLTGGSVWAPFGAAWRSFLAVAAMAAALLLTPQPAWVALGFWALLAQVAAHVLLGGVIYCAVHYGAWLVAGRPDGAERLLGRQIVRLAGRLRPVSAA